MSVTAPGRPGSTLDYPFETRPGLGDTITVAPGVLWARMRLPMQLNHINVWLLADGDAWTVVDTGINDQCTRGSWETVLAGSAEGRPVRRVIVTHLHPDHVGLAGWIGERFDAPLWMTRTDYLMCRTLVADTGREAPEESIRFYRAAGFSEAEIAQYKARFGFFGRAVYRLPQAYRRIQDGQQIEIGGRVWRVVVGRGHAPEHACLWCAEDGLFISGDQILPRISSNVSVFPTEPEGNPLHEWLESCAMLRNLLPDDTLVLPSHNEPFRGAKLRLAELINEHEASLARLLTLCQEPKRAVDVFPALFRSRISSGNYGMATGESIAHLNCLIARGSVRRWRDNDGIDWYKAA